MVNFFQDFKLTDPEEKRASAGSVLNSDENRRIDNLETALASVGPSPQDSAVTHLYKSISELNTADDVIDQKILAYITNKISDEQNRIRRG